MRRIQYIQHDPVALLQALVPNLSLPRTANPHTAQGLRKAYRLALATLHPDKMAREAPEKRVEAEIIYKLLNAKSESFR